MPDHNWIDNIDGTITCSVCGLTRRLAFGKKPRGACPAAAPQPEPSLLRKAANFAAAALKQAPLFVEALLTGDETGAFRSADEIAKIADICKTCPFFSGEICTHEKCGCAISADRSAWLSKLAWRSQRCPDDPPRWGAETEKGATEVTESTEQEIEKTSVSSVTSVAKNPPSVSIVVTARNYGRFLAECLRSCLAQTTPAVDVIYSDDASQDDSLAVARRIEGVTIVEHAAHVGVCVARNAGVSASRGDVLIHVDGDDRLPPDFVARHLAALSPSAPFAYGPAQAFGEHATLWPVPAWTAYPIWERNYVNTSAAYWRKTFDACGGWQETCLRTMWDWSLAIRAQRAHGGRPAPSSATLEYRQHAESWSHSHSLEKTGRIAEMLGPARRELARLSIGCVYSGRLPELLPRWLDALAANIAEAGLPAPPELVVLDNSGQPGIWNLESGTWNPSRLRVLPHAGPRAWSSESERQAQVAAFLAGACNRLLAETTGDMVWLVEDDVLPPPHALRELLRMLTDGLPLAGAAAAPYKNRHCPERFVGGLWRDDAPHEFRELPSEPTAVDLAGTGCLLFWRWAAQAGFAPFFRGRIAAHDWAFCDALRGGGRAVLLVPSARSRHYRTLDEWF